MGGSKAVRKFSENSSIFETTGFPYDDQDDDPYNDADHTKDEYEKCLQCAQIFNFLDATDSSNQTLRNF